RLDMPEEERRMFGGVVYTRIKQINVIPAELNKQVMGLLALNRFIADNPFSSLQGSGSSNFETNLYNTAGELLTKELNDLMSKLVTGVDIDFGLDVNDDYTSGEAHRNTNLKVNLKKSLANNRLTVYVGSTFALEGQNQNANSVQGLAGDITMEYLLTKDGRYRIKASRINQNEFTFQGYVVKTGVAFVMVFEFNKIKQLFKRKKKTAQVE
ncbi:MAG: hypothetical protein RL172_2814, partial [Bacteroidota bacterium]